MRWGVVGEAQTEACGLPCTTSSTPRETSTSDLLAKELGVVLHRTTFGGPTNKSGSSVGLGGGAGLERSSAGGGKGDVSLSVLILSVLGSRDREEIAEDGICMTTSRGGVNCSVGGS